MGGLECGSEHWSLVNEHILLVPIINYTYLKFIIQSNSHILDKFIHRSSDWQLCWPDPIKVLQHIGQ